MKALEKQAPGAGNVAVVDKPPREPGPGEVALEVVGAGVCGTDLHILKDEYKNVPPVTMGHEVSGLVRLVGPDVDPSWMGARVVCETFYSTCRSCFWCRDGRPNLCPERRSIGSWVDGGFAPTLVIPVQNLHRIPGWLNDQAASLSEPLACVCNCMCDPNVVSPGDEVLVVGPGPVGLLAAQVARASGGKVLVVGTEKDELRLSAAQKLGFATALAGHSTAFATLGGGTGADIVIECSGSQAGIASCLEAARRGGRYVQVGLAGRDVTVPFDFICYKELIVTSGFASTPRSWRRAMALIEGREVQLEPLVSEVTSLDEWERVFADTSQGKGIKYVFDPRL
jgi:L-iditol 2-dehydrogenase